MAFYDNYRACAHDTANFNSGTYSVKIDDTVDVVASGTITFNYNEWTERGRIWKTSKEYEWAKVAGEFIHDLIKAPFKLNLGDDCLTVYLEEGKYKFQQ